MPNSPLIALRVDVILDLDIVVTLSLIYETVKLIY